MNRETHQAFTILRFGFTVAPIVAGLDKFLQLLTNWDKYLAPGISNMRAPSETDTGVGNTRTTPNVTKSSAVTRPAAP